MVLGFEPDLRLDMDDISTKRKQLTPCPLNSISLVSTSCASDNFIPVFRPSTPYEFSISLYGELNSSHPVELTPPSTEKHIFGLVKTERGQESFEGLPNTPTEREGEGFNCGLMLETNMTQHSSIGLFTPWNSFVDMYNISPESGPSVTSTVGSPPRSLASDSEGAISPSAGLLHAKDGPISFPSTSIEMPNGFGVLHWGRHSQSPLGRYSPDNAALPDSARVRDEAKTRQIQKETRELSRAYSQSPRRRPRMVVRSAPINVVRPAMCKCDYPGCRKAFQRKEHLKRHKQTFHGEGPNQFSCEFCGKDQFNRQDNLYNHRKLHARRSRSTRGVKFIPAAVPVIEKEERRRRRRGSAACLV